ncbi:MAG: protein kinase [Planctomycetota bacterium]|nr:protein kinase [Planctomycetota bacterium]
MTSTRFKSLNNMFKKVLECLPDGLIVVDESLTIVYVNKTAEWLFGYKREQLLDSSVEMLIPDRFLTNHREHVKKYLKDPHVRAMGATNDLFAKYSDGAEFPVEISLGPIHTHAGFFVSMSVRDVSEREKEREELARERGYARILLNEQEQHYEALLLGSSPAVRMLRSEVERHSQHKENILLLGERGSGEEAMARSIHRHSSLAEHPFLTVDAGLLGTRYGTPLFSDEKPGAMALAQGGTVFITRLAEMPPDHQVRLIKCFNKKTSPPRIIAASRSDLKDLVQREKFSKPLYKLLSVHKAYLPGIHQRIEDIPKIIESLSLHIAAQMGKQLSGIAPETIDALQQYDWTGNFLELKRVLNQAIAESNEPILKPESLSLDQQTFGGYILERKLGAGGMGEVWYGRHKLLAREAAIKLIQRESIGGTIHQENSIKRFEREAKATAQLESQNTIRVYDFGYTETGVFFYVMELLKGMDLYDMVSNFGPLPPARVIHFLRQACLSLEEAHSQGFFHRDIKPDNLYACRLGVEYDVLKVLDFGLVQAHSTKQSRLTNADFFVGTPAYVPPESVMHSEYLASSDLYSLASTAYTLLTGREAFAGEASMAVVMNQLHTKPKLIAPQSPYDVPKELESLILRSLSVDPNFRPESAKEMRTIIESIQCEDSWTQDDAQAWWNKNCPKEKGPQSPPPNDPRKTRVIE